MLFELIFFCMCCLFIFHHILSNFKECLSWKRSWYYLPRSLIRINNTGMSWIKKLIMYFLAVWQEGHDREVWGARWREAERGKIGQVMYLHFFLQLCSPIFLSLIPNLQDHKLLFPAGHRCRRKEMRRKKQLRTLPKACRWKKKQLKIYF